MQRMYSTFPAGWPGVGLLLLRLAQGSGVIADVGFWGSSGGVLLALRDLEAAVGFLLVVGLWTPLGAALQAALEFYVLLTQSNSPERHVALAVIALALAMLGPGAFSLDARLFGRRRIDLRNLGD
jgi:putative oxidoreductase